MKQVPSNLQTAINTLQGRGMHVHVKNHIVDVNGRDRFYLSIMKRGMYYNTPGIKLILNKTGGQVRVGKRHHDATVLEDFLVAALPGRGKGHTVQRIRVTL